MITWAQWGLQDALSPVIEEFIFFHDLTLVILLLVSTFVLYIIIKTLVNAYINLTLLEGQLIECVWTLVPAIILTQIAIPSLTLLYVVDESFYSQLSLKVIGHQ